MNKKTPKLSIKDLEIFFNSVELPKQILLTPANLITNVDQFVKSHLKYVESEKNAFKPYYWRLVRLKELIEKFYK